MKKIGFVVPWYGVNIPGGAEMALRGVTSHLKEKQVPIEILTTCVREFSADWNENFHKAGESIENGIVVKRFPARKRNTEAFDKVNAKLMNNKVLSRKEEEIFFNEMINSPELYTYIEKHQEEYHCFVGIPYMFGPVYQMCCICPEKAVLIPCIHEEPYIYMSKYKEIFPKIKGMIFNADAEKRITERVYDISRLKTITPGLGVETDLTFDSERFRKKFDINDPYILYAGRKDVGKNIYTLIRYFAEYKKRNNNNLKLVLIGGGNVTIPNDIAESVYDLGYVDKQDKYDAYAAAEVLCQPSKHESFSLVIMESWLCERPVLVHEECEVTKEFVKKFNGGFYFKNYFEFEEQINYLIKNKKQASVIGRQGKKAVLENFSWDVVIRKYIRYLEKLFE